MYRRRYLGTIEVALVLRHYLVARQCCRVLIRNQSIRVEHSLSKIREIDRYGSQ